jgi:hypothetical protein
MTQRPTRQARGYDAAYDRDRAKWERHFAEGGTVLCWRCTAEGRRTVLSKDSEWDLGHDDQDRSIIRGPECRGPNRATRSRWPAGRREPEQHPALRALELETPGGDPLPTP